jgi:hypothetical protein
MEAAAATRVVLGASADSTAVGIGGEHRQEEEATAVATEGRMTEATVVTREGKQVDATAVDT